MRQFITFALLLVAAIWIMLNLAHEAGQALKSQVAPHVNWAPVTPKEEKQIKTISDQIEHTKRGAGMRTDAVRDE